MMSLRGASNSAEDRLAQNQILTHPRYLCAASTSGTPLFCVRIHYIGGGKPLSPCIRGTQHTCPSYSGACTAAKEEWQATEGDGCTEWGRQASELLPATSSCGSSRPKREGRTHLTILLPPLDNVVTAFADTNIRNRSNPLRLLAIRVVLEGK